MTQSGVLLDCVFCGNVAEPIVIKRFLEACRASAPDLRNRAGTTGRGMGRRNPPLGLVSEGVGREGSATAVVGSLLF